MLTPEEIELLRKSRREIDQVVGEVLAKKIRLRRGETAASRDGGTSIVSELRKKVWTREQVY